MKYRNRTRTQNFGFFPISKRNMRWPWRLRSWWRASQAATSDDEVLMTTGRCWLPAAPLYSATYTTFKISTSVACWKRRRISKALFIAPDPTQLASWVELSWVGTGAMNKAEHCRTIFAPSNWTYDLGLWPLPFCTGINSPEGHRVDMRNQKWDAGQR